MGSRPIALAVLEQITPNAPLLRHRRLGYFPISERSLVD
jgi:hypothetical protein